MSDGSHRQNVKEAILALLSRRGWISSADIQRECGITRQAAHHHLRALEQAGVIERVGRGRGTRYQLPRRLTKRYALEGLAEDRAWDEIEGSDRRLAEVPPNSLSILRFSFTEMLNNAIDHSRGTVVDVSKTWIDDRILFEVADDGVGAFRTVRERYELDDDFTALQEISKGKLTVDPDRHTGEGIFFTSKAVDRFVLEANGLRWTVDNPTGDQAVGDSSLGRGTTVRFDLDVRTRRTLKEIFDAYTDPDTFEFSRTTAVLRLFESGPSFVSRSEAKRLTNGLERFRDVTVDFAGVEDVGQGFVDELFRVWARKHPEVTITPVNMSPAVEAMVRRGLPGPQ